MPAAQSAAFDLPCSPSSPLTPHLCACASQLEGKTISGAVGWEGKAIAVRYTIGQEALPVLMKRYLISEQTMVVRVMCDDFDCVCTYQARHRLCPLLSARSAASSAHPL